MKGKDSEGAGNNQSLDQLREIVRKNPGSEEFYQLASLLSTESPSRAEARELCFAGIAANPQHLLARLLLAKLFYLDGLGEFCIRELVELQRQTEVSSLAKLLDAFGEYGRAFRPISAAKRDSRAALEQDPEDGNNTAEAETVFAEIELETEFAEALDEIIQSGPKRK